MGDRIGVRSDRLRMVPSSHDLVPEAIESQASHIAETWQRATSTQRLYAVADAMQGCATGTHTPDDELSGAVAAGEEGADGAVPAQPGPPEGPGASRWRTLRDTDLWKDQQFLRLLRSEDDAASGSSAPTDDSS